MTLWCLWLHNYLISDNFTLIDKIREWFATMASVTNCFKDYQFVP